MGSSNALRVYDAWGRKVDDRRPLTNGQVRLLVYMALVARDGDSEPWCGIGHTQLAIKGLGLDMPKDPDDRAAADAMKRKVRRLITPLKRARAIRTIRRATYGERGEQPAIYRLYLDGPGPEGLDGYSADN